MIFIYIFDKAAERQLAIMEVTKLSTRRFYWFVMLLPNLYVVKYFHFNHVFLFKNFTCLSKQITLSYGSTTTTKLSIQPPFVVSVMKDCLGPLSYTN